MFEGLDKLIKEVQGNCDITDSKHAQTYGICTYLIKMREYFLWRNDRDFTSKILNEEILPWISDIEEYWETVENNRFSSVSVTDQSINPFETAAINDFLVPRQLLYSGGFSQGGVPNFFLGRLASDTISQGFRVLIASEELSRGLYGAPAMLLDQTIFIRKHALKLMIWARYEEWRFIKRKNTMKTAFDCYNFEGDMENALEIMTEREVQTLISHEIGEGLMNEEFGPQWREMVLDFAFSKTEIILRAVKDLAADCVSTLPHLITDGNPASIHFYFANFSDMRKELFPELFDAYKRWVDSDDLAEIVSLVRANEAKWKELGKTMLQLYLSEGKVASGAINDLAVPSAA